MPGYREVHFTLKPTRNERQDNRPGAQAVVAGTFTYHDIHGTRRDSELLNPCRPRTGKGQKKKRKENPSQNQITSTTREENRHSDKENKLAKASSIDRNPRRMAWSKRGMTQTWEWELGLRSNCGGGEGGKAKTPSVNLRAQVHDVEMGLCS